MMKVTNLQHFCTSSYINIFIIIGYLTLNDFKIVQESIWDARAEWFNLGLQLNVKIASLEAIQKTHKENCDTCMNTMLIEWLNQSDPPPTWSTLVVALRQQTVAQGRLANCIERRYLKHTSNNRKENHSNTVIARLGKHSHQNSGEPPGTAIKKPKIESNSVKLGPKIESQRTSTAATLGRHDTQHSDDESPDVKRQKLNKES